MTDLDDTDRIKMSKSDRLAVENRVDQLAVALRQHREDRTDEIARFYRDRMIPLEERSGSAKSTAQLAIAVSACAFVLAIVVLITVLVLHYG